MQYKKKTGKNSNDINDCPSESEKNQDVLRSVFTDLYTKTFKGDFLLSRLRGLTKGEMLVQVNDFDELFTLSNTGIFVARKPLFLMVNIIIEMSVRWHLKRRVVLRW